MAGRPKGLPKYGGRKKGTPNKATAKREAEIAASGLTPLEFLISVMKDEGKPTDTRVDAAKAAAPYVHPKLSSVEVSGKNGGPVKQSLLIEFVKAGG